jgi:glycosyltransferase involved in cell wall biosynthesis
MPCFNARRYLEQAVTSACEQEGAEVELIVVDDGSTDGSRELLASLIMKYSGQVKAVHQQNQGPYPARNEGLRHARGTLVAFLDADDYWAPDCLAKLGRALNASGADLAYCGWQNVGDGAPGGEPYVPPPYEAGDIIRLFLKGCPWPIHAALARKSLVDQVHGFSVRRFTSMDYDFWLRIAEVTQRIVRVPEVLAYYRWHSQGQISSVKWRQVLDAWQVRRDFVRRNPRLVAHLDRTTRRDLVDGVLLRAGYAAYWKRDLVSAHRLFRMAALHGAWRLADAKYVMPSLLPFAPYRGLVGFADRARPPG